MGCILMGTEKNPRHEILIVMTLHNLTFPLQTLLLTCAINLTPWTAKGEAANVTAADHTNSNIEKVFVLFKTHLDVGFTDHSSVVTDRYMHQFLPQAIALSERLAAEGCADRYVWTTGS